jgi:hypothetical protein
MEKEGLKAKEDVMLMVAGIRAVESTPVKSARLRFRPKRRPGTWLIVILTALTLHIPFVFGSGHRWKRSSAPRPEITCHIATVSYRFIGDAGTEFRYDGDTWRIPPAGSIELVASRTATTYEVGRRLLPLEVWPRDGFGTRTIPLPRTD